MVNKLRGYAAVAGAGLVLLSLWATAVYGGRPGATEAFAAVAAGAVAIGVSPVALAYGKLGLERWRHRGLGGVTYVSEPVAVDRDAFADESLSLFADHPGFVDAKPSSFPEGRGVIVEHTRFHGTFVRLSRRGRLVVTGVTVDATESVVDALERCWSTSMRPADANPFLRPVPVRGASRVLLAVLITALVVLEVLFLAGAAYPSDAYNPGEKAALVGIDLHADVDPSVSETDGRLSKARFLVSVIREQAVEIRWAASRTDEPPPATSAAAIAADVERLLARVRADGPDADQRQRIAAIERDLASAMREVREARREASTTGTPTPAG